MLVTMQKRRGLLPGNFCSDNKFMESHVYLTVVHQTELKNGRCILSTLIYEPFLFMYLFAFCLFILPSRFIECLLSSVISPGPKSRSAYIETESQN